MFFYKYHKVKAQRNQNQSFQTQLRLVTFRAAKEWSNEAIVWRI